MTVTLASRLWHGGNTILHTSLEPDWEAADARHRYHVMGE